MAESPAAKLAKTHKRSRAPRNKSTLRKTPWDCRCRELREKHGLSMDVVSEAIGISKTAYWQIEQGTDPMLTTATKIAAFYGKVVEDIWSKP